MSVSFQENVPLAPRTTIGLGGPSVFFAESRTADDERECLLFAREQKLPVLILGGGSNLVLSDRGFCGLTVAIESRGIDFGPERDGIVEVHVRAGEPWDGFVRRCVDNGLAGIECLSGIPGRAGGTPIQNVGAYGQETAEVLHTVSLRDTGTLEELEIRAGDCRFGYRTSRFKEADRGRYIVTAMAFALRADGIPAVRYPELTRLLESAEAGSRPASGPRALAAVREAVLSLRRRKAMVFDPADSNSHSCGSFFTNPVVTSEERAHLLERFSDLPSFEQSNGSWKLSAAYLVELGGFRRGYRLGGAAVSERHSLALVNHGTSARELIALAKRIRDEVLRVTGVRLVPEPLLMDDRGEEIEL